MTCKVAGSGAFLHVPKTGGSWVRAVLDRNGLAGSSLGPEHTHVHFEKWSFCVLREPVDWWLSLWRFRNDTNFESLDGQHPLYEVDRLREIEPGPFLHRAIEEFPGLCGRLYATFVGNADYVLQTEHLQNHMALLSSRVGWPPLDLAVPRVNVTRPRFMPEMGLSYLKHKLRETESQALDLWSKASQEWVNYEI